MPTSRPFAYNTGSNIAGTDQVGDLAIGFPTAGFAATGLEWWNGPDEDLGYVVTYPQSNDLHPTPVKVLWDPNRVGTGNALSSGNTIITNSAVNSSVLANRRITSPEKVMFSIRVNYAITGGSIGFGLQDMDISSYVGGDDAKSIGFSNDGDYLHAGTIQDSGLPTWGSVNDVVDVALDLNVGIWWIRVNNGNWNGTRNENPAAGTGSVNSAALNNLYPAVTPYPVNIQGRVTILSEPLYSVPSGFEFLGQTLASLGFYRTPDLTSVSFIELAEYIARQDNDPQNFSNGSDAKTWLNDNGYWTSFINPVVTTDLVLRLDAGDMASYSGSGSTWTDIAGTQDNVTLYGSPTYTAGTPAYFSFNGTNQYGLGSGSVVPTTSYTKSAWFYLNGYQDNNIVSGDGHFIYMGPGGSTHKIYCGHANWPSFIAYPSSATISLNTWYNVTLTFNTTDGMKLYLNGVLDSTYTANKGAHPGTGTVNIGTYSGGNLLNGRVSKVYCYNRSLTGAEVLQNFNADRSQFGL